MNLTHPSEVKALLEQLELRPSKVLGQNFLIDANILRILLAAANLHQEDAVLEIGPGLGVLTEGLARESGRVVAIEKDRKLAPYLRERFRETPNVEIIEGDAVDVDLEQLLAGGLNKVVSNLPYSVGSRLIVSLAQATHPPEQMVVTVQKEVAQRLAASAGSGDYGLLSVFVQLRYKVELRKTVSSGCFFPPPDVQSAIVSMTLRGEDPGIRDRQHLYALLKTCFSSRRKQIATLLSRSTGSPKSGFEELLPRLGIAPESRPENLSPSDWVTLSNALA